VKVIREKMETFWIWSWESSVFKSHALKEYHAIWHEEEASTEIHKIFWDYSEYKSSCL
jgi:hypothetical protein